MRLIKKIAAALALAALIAVPSFATVSAQGEVFQACNDSAAANSTLCQSAGQSQGQTSTSNSLYGPNGVVTKIVKILSQVIGFVAVLMVMIGGLKYVMSQGESANTKAAKDTILYAAIGLVVAIMGQSIVIFVLNKVA